MTGCAHDGNTIPVIAPMDAEGRKVPLDTKALYDSKGKEHGVLGFNFSTLDGPSWSVWLDDRYDGNDFSFFSSKRAASNEIRCHGLKVSRVWNEAEFDEKVTGKTFWWRDVIEQEAADYLEQCGTLEF